LRRSTTPFSSYKEHKMRHVWLRRFIGPLTLLTSIAPPVLAGAALDEANRSFVYQSVPIHPFLVKEFSNWLSDYRPPMVTTVDVAAASDSNRYGVLVVKDATGAWCAEERDDAGKLGGRGAFCYHHVGRLLNGTHVLKTMASSEGSAVFTSLLFVRFGEGKIFWQDKPEPQLRMTVVGSHGLAPGAGDLIKLAGNKVLISVTTSAEAQPTFRELDPGLSSALPVKAAVPPAN
jgi:hypothetical protein